MNEAIPQPQPIHPNGIPEQRDQRQAARGRELRDLGRGRAGLRDLCAKTLRPQPQTHPRLAHITPLALVIVALTTPARSETIAAYHDIPADATVQMFVKPEGTRLRVLIRVPLESMQEMDFPQFGPGYLDIANADDDLRDAAWRWVGRAMAFFENGTRLGEPELLAIRASIPSDRSFGDYEDALAHITGPRLSDDIELMWRQAMLDMFFEYSISSDRSDFSLDPGLERLAQRVVTVLRFMPAAGGMRPYQYTGHPGVVKLDPRWHHAALRFVTLGFEHILDGLDHLLFLLCLVIPFRRLRSLVVIVTAFTVAHSITLITSAFGWAPDALWFPPLVETLIAASIVYMALENIMGESNLHRRWLITFAFGLVHGFGFSFALRDSLQFAGSHMVMSLLSFNVGVELGQLFVLLLMVPALVLTFRYVTKERMGTIILSALVAHTGWHWMTDRWGVLRQYDFPWPAFTVGLVASVVAWLLVLSAVGYLSWWAITTLQATQRASSTPKAGVEAHG